MSPSPWPGNVKATGRWPSFSSSGTTSVQAVASSHMPAMSTMSMSVLRLRRSCECVQVPFGVEPVVPFLVDHDEQALCQWEVLELRPTRLGPSDGLVEPLGGQGGDDIAHHGLALMTYGENLVQRR